MQSVSVNRRDHLMAFVHLNHFPQKRKYTGEPYTVHLKAVAEMAENNGIEFGYEIGLCHDLIEDTACETYELREFLLRNGYESREAVFITQGVIDLTDVYTHEAYPQFNRKKRKKLEAKRLSKVNPNSQSIKYCDLIDNTKSIVQNDPGFAKLYLEEKNHLLSIMTKGNKELFKKALINI